MGLFGRSAPRTVRNISGEVQSVPERPGTMERRIRLFIECLRRIQGDPLASASALQPIGDGCGLEGLVDRIRPVFATDAYLIPWVALRGAMTVLDQETWRGSDSSAPFIPTVELVMGVGHIGDIANADPTVGIAPEFAGGLTTDQSEAVLGVYSTVWWRLVNYEEYSQMNTSAVMGTDLYPNRPVALDVIAWVCVALWRLGFAQSYIDTVPQPDLLETPGWYTEPLFGKAERYWDGRDWTATCRTQGRQFESAL